jgi:hypothetical protein
MKNYFQSIAVVASLVFFITTAYAQNAIFPGTILEGSVLDKKTSNFQLASGLRQSILIQEIFRVIFLGRPLIPFIVSKED